MNKRFPAATCFSVAEKKKARQGRALLSNPSSGGFDAREETAEFAAQLIGMVRKFLSRAQHP